MHLPCDLDKSNFAVEVITNRVLGQRLDLGVGHSPEPEVLTGMFEQPASPALSSQGSDHNHIRDMTNARLLITPGRHITLGTIVVIDEGENALRIATHVVIEMPGFPPPPVVPSNDPMNPFDSLIDGDTIERLDGHLFQSIEVGGQKRTNVHGSLGPTRKQPAQEKPGRAAITQRVLNRAFKQASISYSENAASNALCEGSKSTFFTN